MTDKPPTASLSEQLLLQALNELSLIGQRIARTETQNEAIIASQEKADRRQDTADESRSKMHLRLNEISANVASVESEVDGLKELKPIVDALRDASIERKTVRRVLRDWLKNGYVIGGVGVTAAGGLWHQWDGFKILMARIMGTKLGGP